MKSRCEIVQDLLPLYVDGIVKPGTADFVEQHLQICAKCRAEQEQLLQDKDWAPDFGPVRGGPTKAEEERFVRQLRSWKRKMALALIGLLSAAYALIQIMQ